ncbi:MAG: sterol desaturase family protein [Proteobacteria bacterium]|nr:sterol desaturase family protein [Pseudomonadota bacterium]MDE3207755.1 sterol desaturase family protein [Pseudomonadota bacterium]
MHRIIVFAFPVFMLLILAEWVYGWITGHNTYRINDAISSLSQGLLSQVVAVFTRLFQIGLYTIVYHHLAITQAERFWASWEGWIIAIIFFDFCDYWLHRMSHQSAILWAAHVVHHQSQDFNFSTALRQESAYMILGWAFYLPMALVGVPPWNFGIAGLVVLLYQIWIHTEHIGKLGWFDRIFSSPSNHRVHHAINDEYINRNYGGMLVIWDRLFGTFAEENMPCVFGTRPLLQSWDPIWAVAGIYWGLVKDVRSAVCLKNKMKILFMPPGWKPQGQAYAGTFNVKRVKRYDPPVSRLTLWFGCIQFSGMIGATAYLLWNVHQLSVPQSVGLALFIVSGLWLLGAAIQGRLRLSKVVLIQSTFLACLGLFLT